MTPSSALEHADAAGGTSAPHSGLLHRDRPASMARAMVAGLVAVSVEQLAGLDPARPVGVEQPLFDGSPQLLVCMGCSSRFRRPLGVILDGEDVMPALGAKDVAHVTDDTTTSSTIRHKRHAAMTLAPANRGLVGGCERDCSPKCHSVITPSQGRVKNMFSSVTSRHAAHDPVTLSPFSKYPPLTCARVRVARTHTAPEHAEAAEASSRHTGSVA